MKDESIFIYIGANRYENFVNFDILSGKCLIFIC